MDAYYDPGFFPDNSGFIFQGNGTAICKTALLENPTTTKINLREEECSFGEGVDTPLYQAVGTSLNLDNYLAVTGTFESDSGSSFFVPENYSNQEFFSPESSLIMHPFSYDGLKWEMQKETTIKTPWEIDWNLSPSNKVLLGRHVPTIEGQARHLGYNLYRSVRTVVMKALNTPSKVSENLHPRSKGNYLMNVFMSPTLMSMPINGKNLDMILLMIQSLKLLNQQAGQLSLGPLNQESKFEYPGCQRTINISPVRMVDLSCIITLKRKRYLLARRRP